MKISYQLLKPTTDKIVFFLFILLVVYLYRGLFCLRLVPYALPDGAPSAPSLVCTGFDDRWGPIVFNLLGNKLIVIPMAYLLTILIQLSLDGINKIASGKKENI